MDDDILYIPKNNILLTVRFFMSLHRVHVLYISELSMTCFFAYFSQTGYFKLQYAFPFGSIYLYSIYVGMELF